MSDIYDPAKRSAVMARVGSKDTSPELAVRRAAHALGFRFRLYRPDLPGRPDIVFPRHRSLIFVHGCFWHRHPGCRRASMPKARADFWAAKFAENVRRDAAVIEGLEAHGWRCLVVWECESRQADALKGRLQQFLSFGLK